MDAANEEPQKNILDWDENDVQAFFAQLGYPQYEAQIREHNISGDVLCMLDAETLKEVGVATVGQRLAILKAVYLAKQAHNVPIEDDQYVPPSEAEERNSNVSVDKLYNLVKAQEERLHHLEDENHRLRDSLHSCMEDLSGIRSSYVRSAEDSPIQRQPSFKWASYKSANQSPTKATLDSPQPSPQRMEHEASRSGSQGQSSNDKSKVSPADSSNGALIPAPPKPVRQDSSDNLKSFKVSLDDPAWKVLPAALKKYKINNDDWQNYAMFICYGSSGSRIERCLSYDEKPLLLFQKLKDAKKNPVFMLKHIKDIRSPIAVAQQKHAARKASESSGSGSKTSGSSSGQGRSTSRPAGLQVHDAMTVATSPLVTGITAAQGGWPEVMSPAVDNKERADELGSASTSTSTTAVNGQSKSPPQESSDPSGIISTRENMVASSSVSYAVAIYPYMAEQEDEFDVVVGDTFIILSRARGWWVVQRDPAGTGVVEPDTSKQGWVPAGCLLETSVPVASAVAEATALRGGSSNDHSPSSPQAKKTPILPLSIVSTSFPGVALTDYKGKGDEELDLVKDDALRVFKRYNHWSYAVKEEGGDRGWVPSWYIGKVSTGVTPATPSTSHPPAITSGSMTLDAIPDAQVVTSSGPQPQVSPMSSAFPPVVKSTPVL
ncbi:hypothetical protein GLOTRDRAFT_59689 [Gloeophyllum trabeum ATCC 11539]|uniref:RA-domain-containing protein n=1 Tax=Gloeophyllum trabeum (strain ATCC 11539 / FP-39264 / Madison 617) TaxID=670483 RepID=S7QA94_GLOTA|nr:uncharacterized protein GLOTRDRAFT_59689 [Gloeophyllum trabeum ATCC 11539]EPQ56437.1 hypothetical protein GLOTRDRAFT_59689 [Gloeophyllum trabeum ATCC 11539]